MGTCFSKKGTTTTTTTDNISSSPCPLPDPLVQTKSNSDQEKKKPEETIKKEIFIIQHRKSHEINRSSNEDKPTSENQEMCNNMNIINPRSENTNGVISATPVRTSSCSKEEVDAILIQCGRLSRSSSTGKVASGNKKYSGSKRSYDFDNEQGKRDNGSEENSYEENNDGDVVERIHRHRQRHRQSRAATLSPHGRRRTPSREREQQHNQKDVQGQQQQRSGSRERGNNNSNGRRVSRSPNRRSDSPITSSNNTSNKPGKMVSVPATVSSGETVKRIQVKRNVGDGGVGARAAASPRSRSPARGNIKVSNENQQQPVSSLSRSNSRKAEHSPYRRNPLSEIDTNAVNNNNNLHQAPMKKPNAENVNHENGAANVTSKAKRDQQQQQQMVEEATKGQQTLTTSVAVNVVVPSGPEILKPQTLTRTRSSRQSRDLDINPSYTSLLLEDIQNFHQKNTNTTTPSFSLPACVTKANSILEAVADLNSTTSSNLSSALSEDRRRNPTTNHFTKNGDNPIVESEVIANDDLMEPSFHKYVTVKRGGDMEDEESSGSNSFAGVGAQQNWLSSSSWEPNSADSTDCYTSSRSNDLSPLGPQRYTVSENQQTGIGRGRVGSGRGIYKIPGTAAAST